MADYGTPEEEDDGESRNSAAAAAAIRSSSGGVYGAGAGGGSGLELVEVRKKPRGRPPGSKNKPKPPIVITRDSDSAMRPAVLELSAGSDVIESLAGFSRRRHVGVSVLSASGSVANVTLRHPTSRSATFTLHGRFEILSLAGTFLPGSGNFPPGFDKSPLTISLAGSQGQVIGGTVAGSLVSAGPVVIVVASFRNPVFYRVPSEEEELGGEESKPGKECESSYGVTGPTPLNSQLPADVLPWPHAARPPHHY